MDLEENITYEVPDQLIRIAAYWESTRTCVNMKVLPDMLERTGITWKYYANADAWMNALQAVNTCVSARCGTRSNRPRRSSRTSRRASSRPFPGSSRRRAIRTSTRVR